MASLARVGELLESREIAATHVAELGDRLLTGEMLLVDARPPAGTDHAQYFLLDEPLTTLPTDVSQLYQSSMRTILLGGVADSRVVVLDQA